METKAFQKIYTKLTDINKATCSLIATNVGYEELATVDGRLAQVVKINGNKVTLQVFAGTEFKRLLMQRPEDERGRIEFDLNTRLDSQS